MDHTPKKENFALQAVAVFLVCLIGYSLLYSCDSRLRAGKGPWSVRFETTTNNTPRIIIDQAGLGISNVVITFAGEACQLTNGPTNLLFTTPTVEPPFGELRHHDLMYLPGVITLLAFNHEIELIPRGLFIDRREIPWSEARSLSLSPTNQAPPAHQERKRTKDLK
jgi:hypothetical protein